MGKAPAFPLYAADFYMDTVGWSVEEVGLYFRLLMAEWVNGPLPYDHIRLAKISQLSLKKFDHFFENVSPKFVQNGGGFLINMRLEKTRKEQEEYRKSQVESGRKGAEKRWKEDFKSDSDPNGKPNGKPNGENIALQSSSSLKEKNICQQPPVDDNCPHQEIIDLWHEILPELPRIRHWNQSHKANLRQRWKEDKRRQNLEWWMEFFRYIRTCPWLMGQVDPQPGRPRFFAKLRWAVKADNFVKITEGDYEERK